MGQYDLFRKIAQSSLTNKEREINQIKYDISSDFNGSLSYENVIINGEDSGLHIIDTKDLLVKTILSKPSETFNVGDIIIWNSENWLIKEIDPNSQVQTKGTIEKCNNVLKFYNRIGLSWELVSVPCIITTPFKTNSGLEKDRYIQEYKAEYQATIPDNLLTKSILEKMRFYFKDPVSPENDEVYLIEGKDRLGVNGLKILRMAKTIFNDDDDKILGIADAKKYINIYEIKISSSPTINLQYLNQTSKIDVKFFTNGIEDISPIFTITSSNINVCTVNKTTMMIEGVGTGESNITINYKQITSIIAVTGTILSNHNYSLSISGNDSIAIGQQRTYIASLTDNGIVNMRNVTWNIFADDEISNTTLCSIVSVSGTYGENIILKANSQTQYGYIKLKCISDNSLYSNVKRIQIKSLLS